MDFKKLRKYRGRRAISPVVATLILIIIAIVGAVSVGLIMSGIASSTSSKANVNSAGNNAQTQLLVGGSTTLYPAVSAAATAYNSANGVNIQVQQGGSGAGMEGVAEGVLDIGDASSFSAVSSAISEYPTANLVPVEVGGSGVVFIANFGSGSNGLTTASCTGTGDEEVGITLGALQELFAPTTATLPTGETPVGGAGVPVCTAGITTTTQLFVTSFTTAGTCTAATPSSTCVVAVSRSDLPSGTEDTACAYLTTAVCASTSNNAVALPGLTEVGNPGVLAEVQGHEFTLGFTDIGFAEGASVTPGSTTAAGVTIFSLQSITGGGAQTDSPLACTTGSATTLAGEDCFALPGTTTGSLDAYIKASLNVSGGTSSAPVWPDSTSGTGLTRTFWMVTSGAPNTFEQAFLTYIRSPAATSFWNNAGYYSLYQLTPITPP